MPSPSVDRNLRAYTWYVSGMSFYAWMPVFFLYIAQRVSIKDVLILEAIFYLSVVAAELPSGYFSDRWGRRITLIGAAATLVAAYTLFATAQGFWEIAAAQVLLALGFALNSGTDTSFHLASLEHLGRAEEYGQRESFYASLSLGLGALSALVGGALGLLDMRLSYLTSAAMAALALIAALRFAPVRTQNTQMRFRTTIKACFDALKQRPLGWLFAASATLIVINHIPYEFYQPYLDHLELGLWTKQSTPLIAGAHMACAGLIGALGARMSVTLSTRIGLVPYVLLTIGVQVGLVVAMSWTLHPVIAIALVGRSLPGALLRAPLLQAITPRINPDHRATYLSLQSLAGRIGFGIALLIMAASTQQDKLPLVEAAMIAVALWVALGLAALYAKARINH